MSKANPALKYHLAQATAELAALASIEMLPLREGLDGANLAVESTSDGQAYNVYYSPSSPLTKDYLTHLQTFTNGYVTGWQAANSYRDMQEGGIL